MRTSGWTIEDMLVRAPVALHLDWPTMSLNTTPKEEFSDKSRWKSLEDQAKERRARLREIDDFFQEAEAYARSMDAGEKDFQPVPAWDGMLPFLRGEIPLAIHADELRQIQAALDWAKKRGYRIAIYGGRDAWRMAAQLGEADVPVVYDHVFTLPTPDTAHYDVHFKAPAVLHQAGVKLSFSQGGRFEAASLRNLPYAAAQAVAFGLPESEAIKGLTLYPAEFLGVADRLGSIEPGKEATIFASDGDIFDIRSQVKRMWVAGEEIDLESRHTRLYEKYRTRPLP
jgi:imidazolonepropionase-like amidohydrolase